MVLLSRLAATTSAALAFLLHLDALCATARPSTTGVESIGRRSASTQLLGMSPADAESSSLLAVVHADDALPISASATASSSQSGGSVEAATTTGTSTWSAAANATSTWATSSNSTNTTWSSGASGANVTSTNATIPHGVSANGTAMYGSFCLTQFCVNATYDGTSMMTYSIYGDAATLTGYASIGTGSMMAGSNMFVVWSNDGEVVLSQRSSTGHSQPTVNSVAETTAQLVPSLTSTNSTGFVSTFTYPMNASEFSSVLPMIWAYDAKAPTAPANSSSKIGLHTAYGAVTLQLTTTGGSTTKTTKQKSITWLINVHAIIMIGAWAVTAPAGALIGRYGRGVAPKWMKYHEVLQGLVTPFLTILGLVLAIVGMTMAGSDQFANKHTIMGIILIALLLVQIALGFWCHKKYDALRKKRPARNWLHMVLGMALLGLSGATMYTGIELKGSATWMVLAFWVWLGTLVIAFAGGYALLPKQVAKERYNAKRAAWKTGNGERSTSGTGVDMMRLDHAAISSPISEKVNPYGHLRG